MADSIALTDEEWREFQSIPDEGYSHRAWIDAKVAERAFDPMAAAVRKGEALREAAAAARFGVAGPEWAEPVALWLEDRAARLEQSQTPQEGVVPATPCSDAGRTTLPPAVYVALREAAQAASGPWHPWGDEDLPERSTPEEWAEDMRGYLGGEWGDLAALLDPATVLSLLDRLERAEAIKEEIRTAVLDLPTTRTEVWQGEGWDSVSLSDVLEILDRLATDSAAPEPPFSCRSCGYTSDEYGDTHTHPAPEVDGPSFGDYWPAAPEGGMVVRLPLAAVLAGWRDGDGHGWDTEFRYLRSKDRGALDLIANTAITDGIREPIHLGDDGRVWDGHHRLCVADELALPDVPVLLSAAAAPEDCTCLHVPRSATLDGRDGWVHIKDDCPQHGRSLPAAPVAVGGVETDRDRAWAEFRDGPNYTPTDRYPARDAFDAGWTLAHQFHRERLRRSPVWPETSEPEGGESRG